MRRELAHSRLGDPGRASYPGRITPSRVLAHRASAPHAAPRSRRSCRLRGFQVPHHRPQKPDELTRHRNDGNLWPFPIGEVIVALMQALLRLPGVGDHRGRLPLLPSFEVHAELRATARPRTRATRDREWR